jgi:predicted GNAT family acetyltransferase
MSDAAGGPAVTDNQAESRFEHARDGLLAVLTYRARPGRLVLLHTETPHALEGQGRYGRSPCRRAT